MPAVDTLLVLVWNIACGRQPLYEVPEWVAKLDGRLLGHTADAAANLYAEASLEQPEGVIREVIFPVVSEERLEAFHSPTPGEHLDRDELQ